MSGRPRLEIARNMGSGRPYQSPGARKEKLRERAFRHGDGSGKGGGRRKAAFCFPGGEEAILQQMKRRKPRNG